MAFKKATRAGTKALIGLYGESGSGKTFSALMLARGLAGPDGLVMMIDTENRRGEMYADEIPGGYEVQQLGEPFASKRYSEMISEAEAAAGGKPAALVIDSFSHEWEGIGGVVNAAENIAEARAKKYGDWNGSVAFGDWKNPKQDHKRMMLQMLGSNLHIICCLRAQYASHQIDRADYEKHGIKSNAKTTVIRDDFQTPIQDKNFIFEMMAHIELSNKQPGVPILRKCPQMLLSAFQATPQLSIDTGQAIAAWTDGGSVETEAQAELVDMAEKAASCGMASYEKWFKAQDRNDQLYLVNAGKHDELKRDAADADAANKADEQPSADPTTEYGDDPDDMFPGDR